MQKNHSTGNYSLNNDAANKFNNIESVESVYPVDTIDIIDCVSKQLVNNNKTEQNHVAANDEYKQAHIYSLNNARMAKKSKSIDRRACKSRLTDRRSSTRVTACGEVQQDRREANRLANVDAIRLAHLSKQATH